ncbi:MAG: FRG domain-containing protein [Sphingomonadales bacterium]|nr:MAG: FRG domain-containing protein [Sphingomonadales bacterium]
MVKFAKPNARSLSKYLEVVIAAARESGGQLWFRGHRSTNYLLTPGLYRSTRPIRNGLGMPVPPDFVGHSSATVYAYPNFQAMLLEFKRFAAPHLQAMSRPPSDEFEWIFLMQHYGVRTRLLDWTTDPLIALYFATLGDGPGGKDAANAAIYAMDPASVNKKTVGIDGVISLNTHSWDHYLEPNTTEADFPICVAPAHIDPRVIAQSSVFTLHGALLRRLDDYDPLKPHIAELEIDAKAIPAIREELELLGYDRARVFPELSSIAERVLRVGEQAFERWDPKGDED